MTVFFTDYKTADNISKEIAAGIALGKTAENRADLETVLRRYHAYLNISCNEKYAIYSNDKKIKLQDF